MEYLNKNITTVEKGVIAHGVNCQGAMGSGVAKALKEKWPVVYDEFKRVRPHPQLLGTTYFVRINEDLWVANCYTQEFYGRDPSVKYADPAAIKSAMKRVFEFAEEHKLPVYMPTIGCGLGGLSWKKEVKPIIASLYGYYDVVLYVCDI